MIDAIATLPSTHARALSGAACSPQSPTESNINMIQPKQVRVRYRHRIIEQMLELREPTELETQLERSSHR